MWVAQFVLKLHICYNSSISAVATNEPFLRRVKISDQYRTNCGTSSVIYRLIFVVSCSGYNRLKTPKNFIEKSLKFLN